jgi:hypothetical protein
MSPAKLRSEIQAFIEQAWGAGLVRESNFPTVQVTGRGTSYVSWSGEVSGGVGDRNGPSLSDYADLVKRKQYTLLLLDYSFLQISFVVDERQILWHRLVYYPCPLTTNEDEDGDIPILDLIDLLDEREIIDRLRQETPLRFEFDPAAATEDHPASHLHMSRNCCRIPVYAPLTLGHFIRFIFKHFYPTVWNANNFLRDWGCEATSPTISYEQRHELHVMCVAET